MKEGFDSRADYSQIKSNNSKYIATYNGGEVGMGGPTVGNVDVRTSDGEPIYSSASTAEIQFSGDSKYFIHRRKLGDPELVKIELLYGREL